MASNTKTVIAFDLYGTLLSTESISKELAAHFGDEKASVIATLWRRYQLEYTWRLNSMSIYKPFSEVTKASLRHALSECSESLNDEETTNLLSAYDSLSIFPDVSPGLDLLTTPSISASFVPYIFSNGTYTMVRNSVVNSPSLSPYSGVFKSLVTVQEVECYKPDPRAYLHLARSVGKTEEEYDLEKIWLVSGNPFDVVGSRKVGMRAAWVDRGGKGWSDELGGLVGVDGEVLGPTIIVGGVDEAIKGIADWEKKAKQS